MLTFQAVLAIFGDYLSKDLEEEVLPCRRGYVRVSWNGEDRDCVDGVLCRTPEELFDLLLIDCIGYEEVSLTKGNRNPMRQSFKRSATTIGRSAKRRKNGDLFTQVHAEASFCSGEPCFGPVRLVFYLAGVRVQRGAGPGQRGSVVLGLASAVLSLLALAILLLSASVEGFIIYLVLAFLASPFGLPAAALWLLSRVQEIRYFIQERIYG